MRSSDSTGWRNRYCDAATEKANVLTARSRPRTRSAPTPISAARPAETNAAITMESRNGSRREIEVQHAQIEVHASRQGRRDQGAEPREGHLAERQLARPPGEDDQREPADREARDRGVEQVPRGLRDQERQEDRKQEERAQDDRR